VAAQDFVDKAIFRRSDIRGLYPQQLNIQVAKKIGQAFYLWLLQNQQKDPNMHSKITIAIGRDVRYSSGEIFTGLAEGIMEEGGNVVDLDLIGTEIISFAASTLGVDGGIVVSASHNPQQYNGVKLVRAGAVPIAYDSGLDQIRQIVDLLPQIKNKTSKGSVNRQNIYGHWTKYVGKLIHKSRIKPLGVVIDAGNGMGGMLIEPLLPFLPIRLTKMYFEPDGNFPNHVPNPLIPENLRDVITEVIRQKADLGIAFDGDADRVIFIDESGTPINCSVIGALIAKEELTQQPDSAVLYNAVCGRIVKETIFSMGGKPTRTMVGHSVIKEKMRSLSAIFAVEHSGHFYYKDYFESDSSILTIIKILEIISKNNCKLSEIVKPLNVYFQSGEINFETPEKQHIIEEVRKRYINDTLAFDQLDGDSLWFNDWWFNIRPSQNEDLLRLNIETDKMERLSSQKRELTEFINSLGAKVYQPF